MTSLRPLHAVVAAESIQLQSALDFRGLYAELYPRLFRFGLAFSDSEARAAEAVQEAFLDLICNPGSLDPARGSAAALLYGMVRNRLRSAALTASLALAQDHVQVFNQRIPAPAVTEEVSVTYFGNRTENAVKGAPYSGDSITETVQTLADGNRISRTNKSSLARDSEGRTRRESTIQALGPIGKTGSPSVTVFIDDPVAKISYTLDPKSKTSVQSTSEAGFAAMRMANGRAMGNAQEVMIERKISTDVSREPPIAKATQMKIEAEAVHLRSLNMTIASRQNLKREDIGPVTSKELRPRAHGSL